MEHAPGPLPETKTPDTVATRRRAALAFLREFVANAKVRGPCACAQCAACCTGYPGWFLPGEMERAAKELGLSPAEFMAAYGAVDYWVGDPLLGPGWYRLKVRVAMPRTVNQRPGLAPAKRPRGACALLSEDGCRLSFKARPYECRVVYACSPPERRQKHGYELRNAIASAWRPTKHQKAVSAHV